MSAWHDGPVVDLVLPMPAALAAEIMRGVATACEKHGLEAYFKEADGLGRIHVRPVGGSSPPADIEPS